jgi:hypothetical protein
MTDPDRWTVKTLVRKYDTFPGLVLKHTQCPKERKDRLQQQAEEEFALLPIAKKKTLIDRLRRKALW